MLKRDNQNWVSGSKAISIASKFYLWRQLKIRRTKQLLWESKGKNIESKNKVFYKGL